MLDAFGSWLNRMGTSKRMTLGDFSAQADAYQRSRPGYPAQLVDMLVAEAAVRVGDRVVDLGAGTGIFTELLVSRRFAVTAVEPNEVMVRHAAVSGVQWVNGTFEGTSLPDRSHSWAVAAQAFHWADPGSALPEICRILKPQAVFTVVWNNRSAADSEIVAWTEAAIHRHIPEFNEAYRHRDWKSVLESTADFTFLSHHVVPHSVAMSRERYLELWRSHNRLNNLAGPDRFASFYKELCGYLQQRQIKQVDVPYRCEAWSARRTH